MNFSGHRSPPRPLFPNHTPRTALVHRPPNVLVLLFDKCRTDAIGTYQGIRDRTPNLNQLAASGVRFAHAYTPQALCAPARASLLTGLYPHAHRIRYNPYPGVAAPTHSNFPDPVIDPFRDARFRLWDNFVYYLVSVAKLLIIGRLFEIDRRAFASACFIYSYEANEAPT